MNNKFTKTFILSRLLLLFALACPLSALAQVLTTVAEVTQNNDGAETYTLTYKAVENPPAEWTTKGEGIYNPNYIDQNDEKNDTNALSKEAPVLQFEGKITRAVIDPSMNKSGTRCSSTAYWFFHVSKVEKIEGLENLNTSSVTNMCAMFWGCTNLKSVDVSNFDTKNVKNMFGMFQNCSSLTSLDVSNFNTSKVTNMQFMFQNCSSLTSLDVSNFNTSSVTTMALMFQSCLKLQDLKLNKSDGPTTFNTSSVEDMQSMFFGCKALTSLDVSKFNTQKVTNMNAMFRDCSGLTSLDVSKFNTQNVTNMNYMFSGCSGLTSLDVSKFNTQNVKSMEEMFSNCSGLTSLDVSSFNTQNVTSMEKMFSKCSGLTSLDVSRFNFAKIQTINYFAANCSGLTELNLGNNQFVEHGNSFSKVGTITEPCRLIQTFGRSNLGTAIINPNDQVPPYYYYGQGYFTIADILDTNDNYVPVTKSNTDLWVKGRTLIPNVWNTFVVPVGVTITQLQKAFGDDVEVCTLSNYDGNNVYFTTLKGFNSPNSPLLIKPKKEIKNVGFAGVSITALATGAVPMTTKTNGNLTARFIGNYEKEIFIGREGYYFSSDGKFYHSAGHSKVPNTRGYFTFSDGGTAAKIFILDGSMTTAIDAIDGKPVGKQEPVYNLAGQRVGKDYKGIVIVNGKKVLRK